MVTPGRRFAAAVAVLSALLLLPVHASALDGRSGDPLIPDPASLFVGYDGGIYSKTGWTVKGQNRAVYLGEEFDAACYVGGARFTEGMVRLARFARIIQQSGRRVIFTVAPSKSAVNKKDLPVVMPHGECDRRAMAAQDKTLDTFSDPNYLPIRSTLADLARRGAPAYWRLDSHWTTVGSTRWGQAVANRLNPALARLQKYKKTKRTHVPDVAFVIGQTGVQETEQARATVTKVRSRPKPGSPRYDVETLTGFDLSWTTRPKQKTWQGRTLLLGDSFTYVGMESLIPLFHQGRYMWTGHVDTGDLITAITQSDTIVIEVAQRYVSGSLLTFDSTQLQLGLALAAAGPRG